MRRSTPLPEAVLLSQTFDDGSEAVRLVVGISSVPILAFEVGLLRHALADQVTLRCSDGNKLTLRSGNADAGPPQAPDPHTLILAQHQLELAHSSLLRYQRDGHAEVQHLDIEVESLTPKTLVLEALEFMPLMSADEARRLLDPDD